MLLATFERINDGVGLFSIYCAGGRVWGWSPNRHRAALEALVARGDVQLYTFTRRGAPIEDAHGDVRGWLTEWDAMTAFGAETWGLPPCRPLSLHEAEAKGVLEQIRWGWL